MYVQADKSKENKSRAVANSVTQKKNNLKQGCGFVDNRPEVIAQRKLQATTNNLIQKQVIPEKTNPELFRSETIKDSTSDYSDTPTNEKPVQRKVVSGRLNVIGEKHSDYKNGRNDEKDMLKDWYSIPDKNYWQEHDFKGVEQTKEGKSKRADPIIDHCRVQLLGLISAIKAEYSDATLLNDGVSEKVIKGIEFYWKSTYGSFLYLFHPDMSEAGKKHQDENYAVDDADKARLTKAWKDFEKADSAITKLRTLKTDEGGKWFEWTKLKNQKNQRNHVLEVRKLLHQVDQTLGGVLYNVDKADEQDEIVNVSREVAMVGAANKAVENGFTGAWKVGTAHVKSMLNPKGPHAGTKGATFTLTDRDEFLAEMKQYETGKLGIVSLVPGEKVKDITPTEEPRTGVTEERNVSKIKWSDSEYSAN
ncbi:hypothetical protein Sps_04506 [Shewanella psychrophila]|uniref:Uncharacterized protein n=1 Tax=Shewanella psychrophila TaxID=225848 RepID=A0A1S6HVQ8_9GAMM|nr:hypothetical protein [Shewanella psychrophila]AQS39591.1 hypothetical protein Sps_04506 [Shewanella psychrophila]